MNRTIDYIIILIIITLSSCAKPIEVFQLDSNARPITLKLFADSTFVEAVEEVADSDTYSGTWSGDLSEGSTFITIATRKGYQILTLTPIQEYRIENGKAKRVEKDLNSSDLPEIKPGNSFIEFPIPILDSIFQHFGTSGAVAYSPSKNFYNPTDSGIFVFYTLFDKHKLNKSKYSFEEQHIGTLTTHTYFKPKYGWSDKDKDQTFILLELDGRPIKIGKSIQIGMTLHELKSELGQPIYQVDSSFVFLGKNKVIGKFNFKNGLLESLTYGRFTLIDEIFTVDSLERKAIIEQKLKSKK